MSKEQEQNVFVAMVEEAKTDDDEKLYDNLIHQNMHDVWDNEKDAVYDEL